MKNKIIVYDLQRLYLERTRCFLDEYGITKKYNFEGVMDFDHLEDQILEKDSILIINTLGLSLTDVNESIENFLHLNPSLKIIIHSASAEVRSIKKFFDKGIKCYFGRDTSSTEFLEGITQVIDGKIFVSDDAKSALLNFICNIDEEDEKKHNLAEELTAREKDVLILICEGLRSKEIAEKLFISAHTVESHRRNMMLKFNLNSSSKLMKFALENKLVVF
ncbi:MULTISPECIES: response regulator transcription factor [Chryseobacterium]|uniref:Oxygen regulatory protein NreC n=1 Tax=Chryseobacterium salivictor TaxID=2547600 RepID=A0A4P6ZHJ2_9FLAO|nr:MULTISPECIES: response regulator transcription factor [Chryseobacterium]MDQ0475821.1 DNA-binding NarL/FixJ family response regulator [Chryseobacterium sp. MDT2-18]QBO59250.1 Oxygen regulatory protein NreC [Chryseobacterium salivictor]